MVLNHLKYLYHLNSLLPSLSTDYRMLFAKHRVNGGSKRDPPPYSTKHNTQLLTKSKGKINLPGD